VISVTLVSCTSWIFSKSSCIVMKIIPGCWEVPLAKVSACYPSVLIATHVIVCVFPQPVAPYANTVALYPSSTLSSRGFVVASYTSPCVVVSSKTRSNAKVWSFTRLPCGPIVDLPMRDTWVSSGGSKMLGHMSATIGRDETSCPLTGISRRAP
jgi:hypothetical protein